MVASGAMAPLSSANMLGGSAQGASTPAQETTAATTYAAYSVTPGSYRFIDQSGFAGRVGEYDSLQESAGGDAAASYVFLPGHMIVVSRGNFLAHDDYQATSQVTAGKWAQFGFDMRSFVQQQDNYPFYAFPVLDVPPPAAAAPLPNCQPSADCTTNLILLRLFLGRREGWGMPMRDLKCPSCRYICL
jgi:hypothetical protein